MKSQLRKAFILLPLCVMALTSCKHAEKNENLKQASQSLKLETEKPIDFSQLKQGRKPASVKSMKDARSWKGYLSYVFSQDLDAKNAAASNISIYKKEANHLITAIAREDQIATHTSILKFQSYLVNQSDRMDRNQYITLYKELKNAERDSLKKNFASLSIKARVLQSAISGFETYQDVKKLFE